MADLGKLRQEYAASSLNRDSLAATPIDQFRSWFEQTVEAELHEPNAMTLSTVSPEGQPWNRTVLLKAFDEKGFVFFTNYNSRKAQHIAANPKVSLLLPWILLQRQVIIIGEAEKISSAESLKYFASRPYGSQVGAWVSQQSSVVSSRSVLAAKFQEI
ncbi:MAG: pyridoxamine 5'-phosphate oxidase, partial [Verrucomicrobiota bacterium]